MKIKSILGILCLSLCLLIAPAAAAGGDGTPSDPYIIQTATELQSMQNDLGASYKLANNIDLSADSITWTPIGTDTAGFHGTLDGNGKTISNLTLSTSTQNSGFFGSLTSGATIKDLTFADCSVTTTSSRGGVVIGLIIMSDSAHDTATLDNVDCVRCTIQSNSPNQGCLVGAIYTASVVDIIDCDMSYCNAESTGNNVGCLVGYAYGQSETEITNSTVKYSHAKCRGTGGCFVGDVYGKTVIVMTNCVAENSIVESITNNNVGCLVGHVYGQSAFTADGCIARNCIAKSGQYYAGGILGTIVDSGSTASIQNCVVDRCTIVASASYAGGVIGRVQAGTTAIVTGCDVTNCTILASTYAAGICPGYHS